MAKEIILGVRVDTGGAETELGKLKAGITELRKEQKRLNEQLKKGGEDSGKYADELAEVDQSLKTLNKQYTKTIRDQTTLNTNMKKGANTVDGLRTKLSGLTVEWKSVAIGSKRFRELEKEIKDTSNELKTLESRVGNNTRDVGNYGKAIGGVSRSLKRLGTLLVTVWAGRAIKNAFNVIKDFEQAQANLRSITGATEKEMVKMNKAARALGASTIFTAKQVSELQTEFAKLGFSTQEILNATEATLSLAAATGTDLAEAATVAGATVRGFGLDTTETQRVVDVMAKSFSSSALNMEKFKTAMSTVAPVAKSAGLSIEETTSFLAVLVDRGVDASTAGTGLRNVFLELTKNGLTFNEAMEMINSSSNKNATALELFGKRGATIGTILASTSGEVAILNDKLNDAAGSAEEMANIQLETLSGKLKLLTSAWEGFILGIEKGDGILAKFIRKAITQLTEFLGFINKFTKSQADFADDAFNEQEKNEEKRQNRRIANLKKFAKLSRTALVDEFVKIEAAIKRIPTLGGAVIDPADQAKLASLQKQLLALNEVQSIRNKGISEEAALQTILEGKLADITDRNDRLNKSFEDQKSKIEGLNKQLEKTLSGPDKFRLQDQLNQANKDLIALGVSAGMVSGEFNAIKNALKSLQEVVGGAGGEEGVIEETGRTVKFLRNEIKELNDVIEQQKDRGIIKGFQSDIKDLKDELDLLLEGDLSAELKAKFEGEDVEKIDIRIPGLPTLTDEEEKEVLDRNAKRNAEMLKENEDARKREEDAQREHLKRIQRGAQQFGQISADFIKSQASEDEEIRKEGQKRALSSLATFLIDQLTMTANAAIARATFGSLATPQSIATAGTLGVAQAAILTALINGAAGLAKGLIRGSFAEGGFTGSGEGFSDSTGHQVAGVVHANEYVVPTKVLSTPQGGQMVGLLEAMRRGSFADGGFTTPTMSASQLSANQLSADFNSINFEPVVSVVDIREADEDQQVRVDNSRL